MGSRRTTTRSSSGNGRSSNGDDINGNDINGNNRPSGCSYLSNVRPENRSTLCSVIAQLTEEIQPTFEMTLKSKAVSENCTVKFSCVVTGYPAPQVTWYKDDMQLDRYCGLPKYEIFRNGQNHSLHIYNCTVEDAAIYQASAINSKGIVSCAGVLEVGEMNEFKIHQRYFDKLKQKAEIKRREAQGKENQEPPRTISPDRTQRKRRSTMEAFLSTPSSMEDEGSEDNHQAAAVETEARLQEAAVAKVEEKPVPVTKAAASAITNGQAINDNGSKGGSHLYDTTQKISTTHQTKTPFVKKKIKISSNAKVAKADGFKERVSGEKRAKEDVLHSVALACTEPAQSKEHPEEGMEVVNINSSAVDLDLKNVIKERHKSAKGETVPSERPTKDESICTEVTVSSQKEDRLTASEPPAARTSTNHTVSETSKTEGKKAAKHEKEAGYNNAKESFEKLNQFPYITSMQPQPSASSTLLSTLKEDVHTTDHVTAMDVDAKPRPSSDVSVAHRRSESADTQRDTRTAFPQLPCELAGDWPSEKGTSPCQKKVSVSQPAPPSEVIQAHAKMNRNDAPVSLEIPPDRHMIGSQLLQKTPTERETPTCDIQTSSLHSTLQAAIDKMTQDTGDHSRESNEIHTGNFTHPQMSPLESPDSGENTPGCNVSPAVLQSQVDTAIKTVEGTEIQEEKKVEGNEVGKLLVQTDSVATNEKVVEMETEPAALHTTGQTKTEKSKDAENKDNSTITMDTAYKETGKTEHISKVMEKASPELQNLKCDKFETAFSLITNTPENTDLLEHITDPQEVPKPVTKVISIAELLRSQIKALESTLVNSVSIIPSHSNLVQDPTTTATGTCQELRNDDRKCKLEVKKSMSDRKTEIRIDDTPYTNIKATLVEVYNQLNKSNEEQIETQNATSPPVQALQEPQVIPPISIIDTSTTVDTTGYHEKAKKYEGVMDICQEPEASTPVPPVPIEHSFPTLTSEDELANRFQLNSNLSGHVSQESESPVTMTHMKASVQEPNVQDLDHTKEELIQGKDTGVTHKLTPENKLNSKPEREAAEVHLTTVSDQYKIQKHNTNTSSLQSGKEAGKEEYNLKLIQQESSLSEECLRPDSLTIPTPEPSPLLKKRNCVSPIPSATPQELASGARRKILTPKAKPEEATEATSPVDTQTHKKEALTQSSKLSTGSVTPTVSPSLSRRSSLLQPAGEQTPPVERRSPLVSRRKTASETQSVPQPQETQNDRKPAEKDKHNPFKAPQVIRKIRGENFSDASGHLKLWCQFFNVLSDSTIKWYKNEQEIAQVKRNTGDEAQVNLAIVQASCKDSGVYGCSITNEYGTDSTDILLSADILAGMSLREDLGVGEEIEMTPLIFSKGVADSGVWGSKFFGRIMMTESHIGDSCSHKVWRAKVIYGLEPVFESGHSCIIKVRNPIAYGGKVESCLIENNLDMMKQECKIQNLAREYCKIFTAETRVIENFGPCLEVIPVYLMYRPANTVPYATVETDLTGVYQKYSVLDHTGRIDMKTGSEVEQKCCTLQHWIFQWTNGNLLLSRLEGVDTKITNVGISVKSTGHQGLSVEGNPKVFEQFISHHKCNYYCGLLSLRSLKVMDSLMTPSKPKGSKSPLLQRKMAAGSSSPQAGRKATGSPRLPRKAEQDTSKTAAKQKAVDPPKEAKMA